MKLAVVGAGAMGGSLAAHASRAGHDVTVIDVSPPVLNTINTDGITVQAPDGTFTAGARAVADPAEAGPQDVVVVFVKAHHTESAARSLGPMITSGTAVVTLQNGWGNAEVLAAQVPVPQLVIGVTYNSCTLEGPGRVTHAGRGTTHIGPFDGDDSSYTAVVAEVLTGVGWQASVESTVRTEIWKKLILNCATLPTAALSRLTAGALGEPGELRDLVDRLAAETVEVARAQDLEIELPERVDAIHTVLGKAGSGKPSMLQDVLAGRKTEIETVNLAAVRAGDRLGIPVPLNRAMVALVRGLERSYL